MSQDDNRVGFLQWVLGENEGHLIVCARIARTGEWQETFFNWPNDMEDIGRFIKARELTADMYFCPTLLNKPRCVKQNIDSSRVVWADLDFCPPDSLLVPPTAVIQTSVNRYQAYWLLENIEHALDVEDVNKRIAYRHEDMGCDITGWDLTQRLRIPGTKNHKYLPELHDVKILDMVAKRKYTLSDFDVYPKVEGKTGTIEVPMPAILNVDQTAAEVLESVKMSIHPRAWSLYEDIPDQDWSKSLWQLEMMLFGAGLNREQVFVVVKEAGCNKYERDGKSIQLLWKEVCRAEAAQENQIAAMAADDDVEADFFLPEKALLSMEERQRARDRKTIVEEYIAWAKTVGDAAPQYHEAGAFIALSSLLAGRVRLPTSFGVVVPNLWFMILADTTLTRKTTAMDLAVDILTEIDPDCILATDGSIEGLMTSLSTRPGRPSIFLRDEFSGLLESMNKKDYYAGMKETFTKLYDGKFQKRILKKEVIEVREPVLILFTGGIKERIYQLLTPDDINSGFIPRFCFITANSDITRLKPLGPPTEDSLDQRDEIVQRLRDIYNHYANASVDGSTVDQVVFSKEWRASLTPEAWVRYNKLEETLLSIGIESSIPEVLTPVMARLAMSGLKAAVLIAAAARLDDEVRVHELDIIHAFMYVERWKEHALNIVKNAGRTAAEKELQRIYRFIQDNPGAKRSTIMSYFRLHGRVADAIFDTLHQRSMVRMEKTAGKRGEVYYPMRITKIKEKAK